MSEKKIYDEEGGGVKVDTAEYSAGKKNVLLIGDSIRMGYCGYTKELLKDVANVYYPEDNCRFAPCTHTHEPGCAVKEAVEEGTISVERYESYLGMLDEEGKYRL